MATSSNREERRKRILDRGSDRLALISGRINSLPSSPISSPHRHLSTQSLVFTRDRQERLRSLLSDQNNDHIYHSEGDRQERLRSLLSDQNNAGTESPVSPSVPHQLLKHTSLVVPKEKNFEFGRQVEPQVPKYESISEVNQAPAVNESTKSQSQPEPLSAPVTAAPLAEKTSVDTEKLPKQSRSELNLFSCKQINSCIIASQGTRSVCALMIALLVVLSYTDDAMLGINIVSSERVEAWRPVYVLLLTDVTIVLAQVFLRDQKHSEEAEKEKVEPQEDGNNMTQAIQLMERSLLVYQTARAVFIDFSIYTVVVICGLSLA